MTENFDASSASIGYIVGGGLKENLHVRLTVSPQQVQEGGFVVIESGEWMFYGLVTDLQLGSTDPRFADEQSERRFPIQIAEMLHGQTLYTNLVVMPALMLNSGGESDFTQAGQCILPVKSVPSHHANVRMARAEDVAEIFGNPQESGKFVIGSTREQGHPVCIDLNKFVQRSSGIFGATGTGKSFLTRILLSGLIQYDKASVLMFDMHNEYGFDDTESDSNKAIPGLRTKFPAKMRVVALGRGAEIRGQTPDFHLELAEKDIQPEDIELLIRELNLKETTPATLDALVRSFSKDTWFSGFKKLKNGATIQDENGKTFPAPDSVAAWANDNGVHPLAAEGLHSKLSRVFNRPYITETPAADTLGEIIKALEAGKHVILSFGKNDTDLDYLLVTNLLTRRIRSQWEEKTNAYRSTKKNEPRPLVIAVEEAHKILNREMASQTTFSTIAREMRKYYVTLLIIDQRPSQIYDEVMSQLGTRISGWLGDDADIQSVLSGLAEKEALRGMLARLQPKEEVLLVGWGVPMPIPIRSRRYDDGFWRELLGNTDSFRSERDILGDLGYDQ